MEWSQPQVKEKKALPLLIYLYILLTWFTLFYRNTHCPFEGRGQKTHHTAMNRNLSQETNHKGHITWTKRQTVRLKKLGCKFSLELIYFNEQFLCIEWWAPMKCYYPQSQMVVFYRFQTAQYHTCLSCYDECYNL